MKNLFSKVLFFVILLTFVNQSQAQIKNNVIKANLFGAIVGQFQLGYERAINDQMSLQLSAGAISRDWDVTFGTTTTQEDRGFILIPEYRHYFSEAPDGVYAGAFMRYRSVTSTVNYTTFDQNSNTVDQSIESRRNAIGGGLLIGYQALISDAVAVDLQIGPQYKSISEDITRSDPNGSFNFNGEGDGIGIRIAFNLGIAF